MEISNVIEKSNLLKKNSPFLRLFYDKINKYRVKIQKRINWQKKPTEIDEEACRQAIFDIPYIISCPKRQNRDGSCGTISLEAVFRSYGKEISTDELNQEIWKEINVWIFPTEIISFCEKNGLQATWYTTLPLEEAENDTSIDPIIKIIKEQFNQSNRRNTFKSKIKEDKACIKRTSLSIDEMIEKMKQGERVIICNGVHYMTLCRAEWDIIFYMNPQSKDNHYEKKSKVELEHRIKDPRFWGSFNAIMITNK
jgi:hypothetical protein